MAGGNSPQRHRLHRGSTEERVNPLCNLRALCVSVLKSKSRHFQLKRHLTSFLLILFTFNSSPALSAHQAKSFPFVSTLSSSRSIKDEAFLEDLEPRSFQYFW